MSQTNQHCAESCVLPARPARPSYPRNTGQGGTRARVAHGPGGKVRRRRGSLVLAVLGLLLMIGLLGAGCAPPAPGARAGASRSDVEASLREIASQYAQDQDLARAQARLDALGLANPAQLLVSLAEQEINQGRPDEEAAPLARLAVGLGARSPILTAYLEPKPTATPVPPSLPAPVPVSGTGATPLSLSPTSQPTRTPVPPSATIAASVTPLAATPTATPQPRVLAENAANLRSGPGKAYPVVGRLSQGQALDVIARNVNGDWWQVAWSGEGPAWVAGTTVKLQGVLDTVVVAKNIPPPPPPPTAGPPTAPPPTQPPPKPAVDYRILEQRILTSAENGGCGKHNIFVQVVDPGGAPVNGAVVQRVWAGDTATSGEKDCFWNVGATNEGCAQFDIYGHGDQVRVVSDPVLGAVSSETTRQFSAQDKDISDADLLFAGYCASTDDCAWRRNPGGDLPPQLCNGHYSWLVKFQRTR